jgi:hypothetical protein
MPLNSPIITGDVSGGLHSTSVDKLKGNAVAATAPTNGQTLVWDGTAWTPATPSGGGGGGANGLTYYLNQGTNADAPTTSLPGTPKQLGRSADASQTTAASGTLTTQTWTQFAGFVTESTPQDPGSTDIPAGLWDFNVWLVGVANNNHSNSVRAKVFKYNGTDAPTLLATSGAVTIGTSSALVGFTLLVPETAMLVTDRIFVTLEAYATGNNHSVTGQFGGSTPSHVHTSLGLVAGTGLWKNVAGTLQSPASLLVDADVDPAAAIASSKLATVQVAQGGTGATTAQAAISSLGVGMRMVEAQTTGAVTGTMAIGPEPDTFTVTATGVFTTDGYTPVLGDIIAFTLQGARAENGFWQLTTAGAVGVSAVFTRPAWFTGTAKGGMYMTRFGTTQSAYVMAYFNNTSNADIAIGSSLIAIVRVSYRIQNATTGVNLFTAYQTFRSNGATANSAPFFFQAGAALMTAPQGHAVEWFNDTLFLTTAAGVRTTNVVSTAIPATSTSAGLVGQTAIDNTNNWFYVCTAPNVWKRIALTTF